MKRLATRLQLVVPTVVSSDQTGFISGRQSYNFCHLFNVLYSSGSEDTGKVIISLDAEKAFDRVEWPYLVKTLERFGFSVSLSWIKILYSSPTAAVRTNNIVYINNNISRYTEVADRDVVFLPTCLI